MSLVLGAAVVIAIATAVSWRRSSRRVVHALATLLAGVLLLVLALGGSTGREYARALLIAPGAEPSQVDEALAGELPIFDLDRDRSWPRVDRRIASFSDLAGLRRHHPEIRRLTILGDGLESQSWGGLRVADHRLGLDPPPGPTRIRWARSLELGQTFEVAGSLRRPEAISTLVLSSPDGRTRSISLEAGPDRADEVDEVDEVDEADTTDFAFQDRPRATGHLLYELRIGEARWTLDVNVLPATKSRILWLEDSPSYESRFLLARWREAGHALAVRRRISRDRLQTEVHGMEDVGLDRIRPDLLTGLDLVVLDRPAWERLSPPERSLLEAAVREKGVGLLILQEDSGPRRATPRDVDALLSPFVLREIPGLDSMEARALWQGREPAPPLELPARYIEPAGSLRELVWDPHGRLLAAARPFGAGQIGLTLLTTTYPWILQGYESTHDSLWSHLLSTLLRPRMRPGFEIDEHRPVLRDRRTPFLLRTAEEMPTVVLETPSGEEWPIALRQDDLDPARWHGAFWPRDSGAHRLRSDQAHLDLLVHPEEAWPTWLASLRRQETRERMARESEPWEMTAQPGRIAGMFFLLLLLALAFSWTAEIL